MERGRAVSGADYLLQPPDCPANPPPSAPTDTEPTQHQRPQPTPEKYETSVVKSMRKISHAFQLM